MINRAGIEFALDSNVYIQVVGPNNTINQEVVIHNKATQQLVKGIMRFLRGEFQTSERQTDANKLLYINDAKNYIPCYINIGTGGIKLQNTSSGQIPDYNSVDRRIVPFEDSWVTDTNFVHFSDTKLAKEQTFVPRYPIGVMDLENDFITTEYLGGDIEQIVFATDVAPGTFNKIYGGSHDIFITEIGLYPSNVSGTEDLLARVIFKTQDNVLYVRPQDTIIINWIISIISLNDYNNVDTDSPMTIDNDGVNNINQTIPRGTLIDDNIPFDGTVTNEEGD